MNSKEISELVEQISNRAGGAPVVAIVRDIRPNGGVDLYTNVERELAAHMIQFALAGNRGEPRSKLFRAGSDILKVSDEIAALFGGKFVRSIAKHMCNSGYEQNTENMIAVTMAILQIAAVSAAVAIPDEALFSSEMPALLRIVLAHSKKDCGEARRLVLLEASTTSGSEGKTIH